MTIGHAVTAPGLLQGFDCNTPITPAIAQAARRAGYRYVVRYVPRLTPHSYDLTAAEVTTCFQAGLALSIVQHVESDDDTGWEPTDEKGAAYGNGAAKAVRSIGIAPGTTVWLDLEGVSLTVSPAQVIRYANIWHDVILAAGYQPGVYLGWQNRLTGHDAYFRLKFARYWAAYNLNKDHYPVTRGVCQQQHRQVKFAGIFIDPDTIMMDNLGGMPTLCAPDEWDWR